MVGRRSVIIAQRQHQQRQHEDDVQARDGEPEQDREPHARDHRQPTQMGRQPPVDDHGEHHESAHRGDGHRLPVAGQPHERCHQQQGERRIAERRHEPATGQVGPEPRRDGVRVEAVREVRAVRVVTVEHQIHRALRERRLVGRITRGRGENARRARQECQQPERQHPSIEPCQLGRVLRTSDQAGEDESAAHERHHRRAGLGHRHDRAPGIEQRPRHAEHRQDREDAVHRHARGLGPRFAPGRQGENRLQLDGCLGDGHQTPTATVAGIASRRRSSAGHAKDAGVAEKSASVSSGANHTT